MITVKEFKKDEIDKEKEFIIIHLEWLILIFSFFGFTFGWCLSSELDDVIWIMIIFAFFGFIFVAAAWLYTYNAKIIADNENEDSAVDRIKKEILQDPDYSERKTIILVKIVDVIHIY